MEFSNSSKPREKHSVSLRLFYTAASLLKAGDSRTTARFPGVEGAASFLGRQLERGVHFGGWIMRQKPWPGGFNVFCWMLVFKMVVGNRKAQLNLENVVYLRTPLPAPHTPEQDFLCTVTCQRLCIKQACLSLFSPCHP